MSFIAKPVIDPGQNRRTFVLALIYAAIIAASFWIAYEVRFDFFVPENYQAERLQLLPVVVGIKLVALIATRQLGSLMTYFSVPDLLKLIWGMSASSVLLLVPRLLAIENFSPPRGVLLSDFMLCLGGLCIGRLGTRLYRERIGSGRSTLKIPQQRIAIVGAGDAGASLATEFINSPSRGFRPVMFFDDDAEKHGKLVHGVPVVGRPESILNGTDVSDLTKAVIAMPSAPAKRVGEIVLLFTRHGLKVETLPSLVELASGRVRASRIRPVEVQDLLGREAVNLDSAAIRSSIEGRCVLVTGAGGSIGGELCRQIATLRPSRLLMLDQAEGALFTIEQEMDEIGLGATAVPVVADVLDRERIESVLTRYRPQILFHAAAHKHVFMMERQPAEAIRNNVVGTEQLARLAAMHGVEAFVFISTDKAIHPASVMGATKRLAEIQLMALGAASAHRTKFMAVRFGNVLGSSGSVIPIFKRQIAHGGPVTVTHPDVTRYFMTISEAVGLVLQSFVLGRGGEIFVLDMGQPIRIVDLARQMIELSGFKPGEDIEIKFTGLRPGEKLFEELRHHAEAYAPTAHPRIMRFTSAATINEAEWRALETRLYQLSVNELKAALRGLVPEYTPFLD